ncbi:hypothetical protein COB64_02740 [Candidatus Wolfebacteria bacterium]|nr:MAG: hypothetical protein COB64_02740 [Candidatus Wolfebacteria bacterium]
MKYNEIIREKIYDNLKKTGLLNMILENSQHADIFNKNLPYTRIDTYGEFGKDANSIFIINSLRKKKDGEIIYNQPVSLMLYRILKSMDQVKTLIESLWSDEVEKNKEYLAKAKLLLRDRAKLSGSKPANNKNQGAVLVRIEKNADYLKKALAESIWENISYEEKKALILETVKDMYNHSVLYRSDGWVYKDVLKRVEEGIKNDEIDIKINHGDASLKVIPKQQRR